MGEGSKLLNVLSLESKEVQKYLKEKSWQGGEPKNGKLEKPTNEIISTTFELVGKPTNVKIDRSPPIRKGESLEVLTRKYSGNSVTS